MPGKTESIWAGAAVLGLVFAPPLAAQCRMIYNVSVYNDAAVSEDRTMVYGVSTTSDNSILCTCGHGSYQTRTTVYAPDGAQYAVTSSGFASNVAVATGRRLGTWTVTGNASLFCSCAGLVGAGGVAATIQVQPAVRITSADADSGAIQVQLGPPGLTGTFVLDYLTAGGQARTLAGPVTRSSGTYTDSLNLSALQFGDQLRTLRARWTVGGVTGEGTRPWSMDVMESAWRITCYNRPLESGAAETPTVTACTTTVGAACSYSPRLFRRQFLDRVNMNGSGRDLAGVVLSLESFCGPGPETCPDYAGRRYRRPSPGGACGAPVRQETVAHLYLNQQPGFECGRKFLIEGMTPSFKILGDTGGGLVEAQLDLYRGEGEAACDGWPSPYRKVVRIND